MKKIALGLALITPALFAAPQNNKETSPLLSAGGTSSTALLCKMMRISDEGEVQMSVLLKETDKIVTINGQTFTDVKFEPYRIAGFKSSPNLLVPGISRETSFTLDRVT